MEWTVYLVKCSDGTLYCGITNNLKKRIKEHNTGKGAKYTKGRTPVRLVAYRKDLTRSLALKIECAVKKLPKHAKKQFLRLYKSLL